MTPSPAHGTDGQTGGGQSTRRLRVATFNLENLDDRPGLTPDLAQRIAVLRPRLQALAADILCLQEVNGQRRAKGGPRGLHALDTLLEGTDYHSFDRIATRGPKGVGVADVHNLVVLSRWPIVASREVRHDLVPPPVLPAGAGRRDDLAATWDRPLLAVSVALPGGQRLEVLNLHLRAPLAAFVPGQKSGPFRWNSVSGWAEGFFLASAKRSGQALEARLWIDRLFEREAAPWVLVCGDFNAEEQEVPLRIIRGDPADVGNAALADRAMVALEHDRPRGERYSVLHGGRRIMLDHILASRALAKRLIRLEIDNRGLGDELVAHALHKPVADSFHAALVATFELR